MISGQEQVTTAQHSLHMENGPGKRAQDPGVELARWLLCRTCHCDWQDVLVSTVQKTLGLWVNPAGHLAVTLQPPWDEATVSLLCTRTQPWSV